MSHEFDFKQEDFNFIAAFLKNYSGITLGEGKQNMVYSRLSRRLRELNFDSFGEYIDYIQSPQGAKEVSFMVNALTTNLTKFFRESYHFDHLVKVLQTKISNHEKRLRIWSAASSSGEEPYSISMTVAKTIKDLPMWNAKILATDLDSDMVAHGKAGVYSKNALENIPLDCQSFISVENDRVRMNQELKNMIAFKQMNLLEQWPFKGPFDVIFCRNVVIYFDTPTKITLFERIANMLRPGGWLYIGHSENLFNLTNRFHNRGKTIYQLKD
jgi:chemotaxis protein methyltransferase CheR